MTDIMVKKVQDSNKSCCSYSDLFSGSTFSGHSLVCILCISYHSHSCKCGFRLKVVSSCFVTE